jgi:putative transposase
MVSHTDVKVGQLYSLQLPDEPEPVLAVYVEETRYDMHLFHRERTKKPIEIDPDEFDSMRCDGRANRILLDRDGKVIPQREIDPVTLLDPTEPGIRIRESDYRLRQQKMLKRRQALRFYVMRYDEWDKKSKGRRGLGKFIVSTQGEASLAGHEWVPSPSTLLRAAEECGMPGSRPLSAFLPNAPEIRRERRWPKEVISAASRAIEAYWGDSTIDIGYALAMFAAEAEGLAREWSIPFVGDAGTDEPSNVTTPDEERLEDLFALQRLDPPDSASKPRAKIHPLIPTMETVRLWIRGNANWYTWASRYGVDNANRRFRGRGRPIEATRPLEYVLFDHTKIDVWAVVLDDEGHPLFVARAWLTFAIDLYSRMILGAVIGYEPPSIQSVTACLRQVVRKKEFLLKQFGELKGACDGWGMPFTVVVDNGKDFVSPSFQASCEAVGIDVIWAPVRSPTFKPHVERAFGTFNTMLWHKLPGGLPLTPQQRQQLGLEPEASAAYTKPTLEAALWNTIVTRYHLETQDGIGMAPALKWARGLARRERATVPRIGDLDKIVGRSKMVLLSVEGVTIHGNRFHDQEQTTRLMNKLARFGKERRQRRGVTSSRTVWVRATWDPGDVTRVHIWDPVDRTSITLPNWNRRFSDGLSWYAAAKIREWAALRNQKFHSDAEKAAARLAHRQYLLEIMPGMKSAERHQRARLIEPRTELVPGNRVEVAKVAQRDDHSIDHDIAAVRADHAMEVKRGRPFGGKKGAAKATATRARNRSAAQQSAKTALGAPPRPPSLPAGERAPTVDLVALRARVDARTSKTK